MDWKALALKLELRGDLHCGALPLGFVARTFSYVPCHLPVFAMVPPAVMRLGLPDRHESYKAVEGLFRTCLRSSPLYVMHEGKPLFPWLDECRQILEHNYISSHYGIGIDNKRRSARESCLFETEVILAKCRGTNVSTRLEGCLFFRSAESGGITLSADGELAASGHKVQLAELCSAMRLGGDRSRALGRPALASLAPLESGEIWGYPVTLDGEWPALTVKPGKKGPMPVATNDSIEPASMMVLTGRRHTKSGAGMGMDKATVACAPGWQSAGEVKASLVDPRYAQMA